MAVEAVDAPSPIPTYSQRDLSAVVQEWVEEEVTSTCAELAKQSLAEVKVHVDPGGEGRGNIMT